MNKFLRAKLDPWGLLAAAGTLACLCTTTGFLDRFGWVFDLTSHFRVQYAASLLLFAAIFSAGRRWKTAGVFAGFAALNCAVVLPYCYTGRVDASPANRTLRVLLLNVHTQNRRYDLADAFIREADPDVVLLEEVNDEWLQNLGGLSGRYAHSIRQPREDNFGIALLSKFPLERAEVVYLGEARVPSITAVVRIGDRQVRLLGTHPVPPISSEHSRLRNGQLDAVARFLRDPRDPVILLGDLNTTPWSHSFQSLLRTTGLADSARGRGWQTTWPARAFPLRIALDHCLLSQELKVANRQPGRDVGSDHLPLVVELVLPAQATP